MALSPSADFLSTRRRAGVIFCSRFTSCHSKGPSRQGTLATKEHFLTVRVIEVGPGYASPELGSVSKGTAPASPGWGRHLSRSLRKTLCRPLLFGCNVRRYGIRVWRFFHFRSKIGGLLNQDGGKFWVFGFFGKL